MGGVLSLGEVTGSVGELGAGEASLLAAPAAGSCARAHEQSDRVAIKTGAKTATRARGADETGERADVSEDECTMSPARASRVPLLDSLLCLVSWLRECPRVRARRGHLTAAGRMSASATFNPFSQRCTRDEAR